MSWSAQTVAASGHVPTLAKYLYVSVVLLLYLLCIFRILFEIFGSDLSCPLPCTLPCTFRLTPLPYQIYQLHLMPHRDMGLRLNSFGLLEGHESEAAVPGANSLVTLGDIR